MTLLTEEAAKQLWCPMARMVWADGSTESASWNRWTDDDSDGGKAVTKCIASQCMAWRWLYDGGDKKPLGDVGYCGAFGEPK